MDKESLKFKIPPHSIESEHAVLGGLLTESDRYDDITFLTSNDFYTKINQDIFSTISKLTYTSQPVDAITVIENLKKTDYFDESFKEYVVKLVENSPGAVNIEFYAKIISEKAKLRRLISSCSEIINTAFDSKQEALEVIDRAESLILEFSNKETISEFKDLQTMLNEGIMKIDERFNSDSDIIGLETGFEELDLKTSGLNPGELIIVAGRPSMGKTTLAMNIAENMALNDNAVGVFSLEMPSEQLMNRMFSSVGSIELQKIRTGKLRDSDFTKLGQAINKLNSKLIFVDDRPSLTINEINSSARRMDKQAREKQKKDGLAITGLQLIVIDYLQLMSSTTNFRDNLTAKVTEISQGLKRLAKELNVPIIALSQLNREVEKRLNKRPKMSDLRESGAIEQDADVILFVYRDEVYDEETEYPGTAELIIGKQRNGELGTILLNFQGEYTKFSNYQNKEEIY